MKSFIFFGVFIIALYALKLNSHEDVDCLYVPACQGERFTEGKFDALGIVGVSACLCSCFELEESSDYSTFENVMLSNLFDVFVLVGKKNRRVLGTVSLWPFETEQRQRILGIFNVCLSPSLRGKGNGEILIQEALKMYYLRFDVRAPSIEKPVLLVLTVMVTSPTFMSACNLYRKLGFYSWECGNFVRKENWVSRLDGIVEALKNANCSKLYSCGWNCQCESARIINDWHVTMLRLDFGIDGLLRFALPPTDFCQRLKKKIEGKVEVACEVKRGIEKVLLTEKTSEIVDQKRVS